jgi:broad specificity phosphatase PhoE
MRCFLFRHAETDFNSNGNLSCSYKEPLNSNGLLQAKLLADHLIDRRFTEIWCSPLPRAKETIAPYGDSNSCNIKILPDLCEGQYNLNSKVPLAKPEFKFQPVINEPVAIEDETIPQFRGRVQNLIGRLMSCRSNDSILVMTHGHFIREFINMLLSCTNYCRFPVNNCSETFIEIGQELTIHYINRDVIQQIT